MLDRSRARSERARPREGSRRPIGRRRHHEKPADPEDRPVGVFMSPFARGADERAGLAAHPLIYSAGLGSQLRRLWLSINGSVVP